MTREELKNLNCEQIEALTEAEAAAVAEETENIKGYTVYYIDFGGYFGYSALPYADGRQIRWANDYELHHKYKNWETGEEVRPSHTELKEKYQKQLNNKFYTLEELAEPYQDYTEKEARYYYINQLFPLRREYHSIFGIFRNEEDEKKWNEENEGFPIYAPTVFAYFKEQDREFVEEINRLNKQLAGFAEDVTNNLDYWVKAFKHEMFNHEYGINWQADYDVLSCFGRIKYHGDEINERELYFNELGFNETQRKAYAIALKQYDKEAEF